MSTIPVVNIKAEIQSLSPSAYVEMFVIDATQIEGGALMRFHSGIAQGYKELVWQGETYQPLPLEASGFDLTAQGTLPRPKIRVANVGGLFSSMAIQLDDLINAKVTRKRTFARYLDAVNFTAGNPEANPDQYLPDEVWYVDRKVSEDKHTIEWELASAFDVDGVQLPYRQVIKNSCCWRYRSSECGYTGPFVDKDDQPTSDVNADYCTKKLAACRVRFGIGEVLPFGGFPGAQRAAG